MTLYLIIKYLHILLAIVAVGFNASYAIWLGRAAREPQHLSHVLRGIKALDDRFANPGYGLLLATGLLMVWVGRLSIMTLWIGAALAIYVVLIIVGGAFYSPTLRRQIAALESDGAESPEYQRLAQRGTTIGLVLLVLVLTIIFLMVVKPTL